MLLVIGTLPCLTDCLSATVLAAAFAVTLEARAEDASARVVASHGYSEAIELKLGKTRAVLCPQAGGRVLEFSVNGVDAMYFDEAEKKWQPGKPGPITAGRFDYGPELTVIPHPKAWEGEWTAEITKVNTVKLTSPREEAGIQVLREFRLVPHGEFVGLSCTQTMTNISKEVREVCHWGRSFSPGGGILRDSARRSAESIPKQIRDVRRRCDHQRAGERRQHPRARWISRDPGAAAEAEARVRHLRRLACVCHAEQSRVREAIRDVSGPRYNEAAGLTLSVWYPTGPRIELEPIGPRERLKPGESASFTEDWWLRVHPFPGKGQRINLKSLAEQVGKQTTSVSGD